MPSVVSATTVLTRRKMLAWASTAALTGIVAWLIRLWSPARVLSHLLGAKARSVSFDAGKIEHYEIGKVDRRWKNKYGVWLIRTLDGFYALSAKTASGEDTEWDEKLKYFRSVMSSNYFYKSGIYFKGPEKASLKRIAVRQTENGRFWVGQEIDCVRTTHGSLPL